MVGDASGTRPVETQGSAVAQRLGPPVEPDIVLGLNAMEILQRIAEPQGCGHVVIGNTDPLALHIGEAGYAGSRVDIEVWPVMSPAQEDRQCRPVPLFSVGPLAGQ